MGYITLSGFSALGLAIAYKKSGTSSGKKVIFPLIYADIMITAYFGFPPNPDQISISMDLIQSFRVASALTISVFWIILAAVFGSLWDKFRPHEQPKLALV